MCYFVWLSLGCYSFETNKTLKRKLWTCICWVFNVADKTVLKLSVQLNSVKFLRADNSFSLFTYTQVSVNRFRLHLQGSNRSLKLWFTLIAVRPTAQICAWVCRVCRVCPGTK